jgi:hypothetical protein
MTSEWIKLTSQDGEDIQCPAQDILRLVLGRIPRLVT